MIDETVNNLIFLKDTIGKFKNEIQKFIADPNYVNSNAMNLRQRVEELEKNILQKEKTIAGQILNNNRSVLSLDNKNINLNSLNNNNLPNIYNYAYNSLKYERKSSTSTFDQGNSNFNHKRNKNMNNIFETIEREEYRKNVIARRIRDPQFQDIKDYQKIVKETKRQTENNLKKYITMNEDQTQKIKRSVGNHNYMDKSKLLKYSTQNKNYYQGKNYDNKNRLIITQDELEKGLLNMIYKGLVPKDSDLTPAFTKNGHPLSHTNKVKEIYTKTKFRDEIQTEIDYKIKNIQNDVKSEGLFITAKPHIRESPIKETTRENEDNLLTTPRERSIDENPVDLTVNMKKSLDKTDRQTEENFLEDFMINSKYILTFTNFKLIQNEEYQKFKIRNEERWGVINYLIEHLNKLFKKLNYHNVEVDGNKLEKLAIDELRTFMIKDFLNCITEKDLISKGIDINNPKSLSFNIKDIFILRLQKAIRVFLSKAKTLKLRNLLKKVHKVQRFIRLQKLISESKRLTQAQFEKNLVKWNIMIDKFKENWKDIKNSKRVEIHMNSLSFSNYKILTVDKFLEKENNQLSRLISLADPNVEIIYISPYEMSKEVLAYFFSILQTLGIKNAKERFHLIVPEMKEHLPINFSLSQLLFCSIQSLFKIRNFIKGREMNSYIIPGTVSDIDLKISIYLNCPILINDYQMTHLLFTKSGSKRVFELADMALPISAWDIKSENEFFDSLTDLIKNYLTINIWIFKIDTERNGRGIAYVVLDKIKSFVDLKKDKLNNIITDEKFEINLKNILKKTVPKKAEIVTSRIYSGWEEYFAEFCRCKGVIESCPTNSFSSIIGSPAISFFVEPDGNVDLLCTYDKLNISHFRSFGYISPQQSILNLNSNLIVQKLGNYLYSKGIFGYVTVEFICFYDNLKTLFWGIDLNFGLTDTICNIKFSEFLYNFSNQIPPIRQIITTEKESINTINTNNNPIKDYFIFTIPWLIHPNIANIKMKDLVHYFRSELLVFDLEKKSGIIFNLPDVLQCGMFGISGITSSIKDLWKLIDNSNNLLKNIIFSKDFKPIIIDSRTDLIDLNEIISRIKIYYKNFLKDNK